ncbi:hypothetical protein RUND412_001224 [Rhizina undulata]
MAPRKNRRKATSHAMQLRKRVQQAAGNSSTADKRSVLKHVDLIFPPVEVKVYIRQIADLHRKDGVENSMRSRYSYIVSGTLEAPTYKDLVRMISSHLHNGHYIRQLIGMKIRTDGIESPFPMETNQDVQQWVSETRFKRLPLVAQGIIYAPDISKASSTIQVSDSLVEVNSLQNDQTLNKVLIDNTNNDLTREVSSELSELEDEDGNSSFTTAA